MKAVQFVLAVPLLGESAASLPIQRARCAEEVCGARPQLWANDETPLIDLGDNGFIVGIIFSRNTGTPVLSIPVGCSISFDPEIQAAWLVRECWGGYVAVLRSAKTGDFDLLVDPAGQCPAYSLQTQTHVIIGSHPVLLERASGKVLKVSWQGLRSHLVRPDLRQRSTCLANLTEIAPGELVRIGRTMKASVTLWRPETFMPSNAGPTLDEATEELRNIAITVIGAWARQLGPVAVAASGGVDSSFICSALAKAGLDFSCITIATADPSGDERRFVRLLGDHLGIEIICAVFNLDEIDPLRAVSAGLPRPSRKSFMAALDAALFQASESVGAKSVFDGNGGDSLFCFLHSAAPIIDRLRCERPSSGVVSTFFDMCRLTGCPTPDMTRAVMRRMFRRQDTVQWMGDDRLIADTLDCPPLDPLTHWFDTNVGRHDGKRDHLTQIMRTQNYVHGIAACGLPRFSALMSQPLIEFCLGIPTWLWCTGGINRALARNAFAAELPREILWRTSKAGPESFLHSIFGEHRLALRDLLMDGLLGQYGLIDLPAIEAAMKVDSLSGGAIIYRLLDLAEAENWARSWHG